MQTIRIEGLFMKISRYRAVFNGYKDLVKTRNEKYTE